MTRDEPHATTPAAQHEPPAAWRRYALALGAMTVAALVALAGLQLVVDPLAVHGTGLERFAPWRSLHFRGAKGEALARGGYEAIILGTSRAMAGFDPQHPAWQGRRVYDASLDGTNLWELERQWRVADTWNDPDVLLIETSLLAFGAARTGSADFADSRLPTGSVRVDTRLGWLFGTRVLALAAQVVRQSATGSLPRRSVRPDGHREYRESPESNRALFEGLLVSNFLVSTETYNGFTYAPDRVAALERIVMGARAQGIRVILVIPPVHAVQFEVLERMGCGDDLVRLRADLVDLVHRANADTAGPAVRVWDFMGWTGAVAEPISGDDEPPMAGFYESSHFTADLGGVVLDRVLGGPDRCDAACAQFGVDLAEVDLGAHAARLVDGRRAWLDAHPAEVEWLDALEARTETERARRLRQAQAATPASTGGPGGPL